MAFSALYALTALLIVRYTAAALFDYYNHQNRDFLDQTENGYDLYLKPVLVPKSKPIETMYLTVQGKEVVLYPSAMELVPYPTASLANDGKVGGERVRHHVEKEEEYEGSDGQYSGTVEQAEVLGGSNSTDGIKERSSNRTRRVNREGQILG